MPKAAKCGPVVQVRKSASQNADRCNQTVTRERDWIAL
jgi:hypothetical protein